MTSPVNATRTFLIDLAERAGKTFYQTAVASLTVSLAGSGLSLANLPTLSVAEKIGGSAALAGIAAVLSMLSSVVSGLKTGTASASKAVADSTPGTTGVHAADVPPLDTPIPHAAILPVDIDGLPPIPADPAAAEVAA
jgi:hypothetical protein